MKYFIITLCGLLMIVARESHAQLSLAIQMEPNPSPYISDWRSNPNTIRFVVTNPTSTEYRVRFSGYIEGDIRGKVAQTADDHPIPPVIIPPGVSMFNALDVYMLEEGVVVYTGPSREETRRSGRLPEDDFRLCATLIEWDEPHMPLSVEACTRFAIRLLLAPTLIAPSNASVATAPPAFQWSAVPIGGGKMANYELTVIELDPGQSNTALAMKTNLPLIQRIRGIPMYQLLPSDPQLEKGRHYAWQVRAFDINERFMFVNDGYSEIWSFEYNPPVPPGFATDDRSTATRRRTPIVVPEAARTINTVPHFTFPMLTRLRGRLLATFYPSRIPQPRSVHVLDIPLLQLQGLTPRPAETEGKKDTRKKQTQTKQTTPQPPLQLVNLVALAGKEDLPMPGVQLALYRRVRSVPASQFEPLRVGDKVYSEQLVATTTTNADGSFEFTFLSTDSTGRIHKNVAIESGGGEFRGSVTGDVYRYYQIQVVNGHLCSPSDEFAISPMEIHDAGDMYSLVRSYSVKVKTLDKEVPDVSLSGMNVKIIRRTRLPGVPENEGTLYPPDVESGVRSGDIIARGETNADGIVTFRDMVKSIGPADYYDVVATNPDESVYWYATTSRTFRFFFPAFMFGEDKDDDDVLLPLDNAIWNEDYNPGEMHATVHVKMLPRNPRIKGRVYRADNLIQPLKNAKVTLFLQSGVPLKISETMTNDSGGFVFSNLAPTEGSAFYFMRVERYGYKSRIVPTNIITDPIKLQRGRQRWFPQIPLTPKLVVSGRIVDEFGRPVAATVRIGTGSDIHTVKKWKPASQRQSGTSSGLRTPVHIQRNQLPGQQQQQQSGSQAQTGSQQIVGQTNPLIQQSSVGSKLMNRPTPKLGNVALVQMDYDEVFTTPAATGLQWMYIMPDNIQLYHPDTLLVYLPDGTEDIGEFAVYVKAHRLAVRAIAFVQPETPAPTQPRTTQPRSRQGQVGSAPPGGTSISASVQLQMTNTPPAVMGVQLFQVPLGVATVIKDAVITVNGMQPDSVDASGISYFVWFSPGDDAEVRVAGPPDSDYVPKTVMTTVDDESIEWREMNIPLVLGGRISGTVSVGAVPIPGARVAVYDNPAETDAQQTFTNDEGKYTLRGVHPGGHVFLAAKSKSQFIGDTAAAWITAGQETILDFQLTAYNDMDITTLLGFPMEVAALDSSDGNVRISGACIDFLANDHFAAEDSTSLLPFENVIIQPSALLNENNIPFSEPVTLPVITPVNNWDIGAFDVYRAALHDQNNGLRIGKADQRGEILGSVSIKPSSFTFPGGSLSLGSTRIALATSVGSAGGLTLAVLTSDGSVPTTMPQGYHAVNENGDALRFHLYDFDAVTDSTTSYFDKDTLSLPVVLHTNIANIAKADLALDIGTLRVHHDYVEPVSSLAALDITLEGDWKIASNSWTLDHNGLTLDSGQVRAGYIGVPFTSLKIFPHQIAFGDFSLDKLIMSGVATINITGATSFGFDPGTQHWSLAVGPKPGEDVCGWMLPVEPMAATDRVMFENFFVQASGSKGFNMSSGNSVTLGKVGAYVINQFIPKENFIQIAGSLNLGIPNLPIINQIGHLSKTGAETVFRLDPINETIAVKGVKIKFSTSEGEQYYDNTGFHSGVTVSEEGAFALKSMLHRTLQKTHIVVNEGEKVQIGTQTSMTDVVGAMEVADGAWQFFWFEGDLQNNNQGGRLLFTVMGDIVANDQEIGVDNIETPFGEISLVYNFQEAQLEGTLHVEQDLGGTLVVGDATLLISGAGKGWYFFCGASFTLPQPKVDGTAAFAVGNFQLTQTQLNQFAEYSYNNNPLPPQFHNFNGFFFEGTVMMPPPVFCPNFDFDFGIVSAYMICQVGANARFGINFGPVNTYFVAMRGIGKLEVGVGMSVVIACAGVSAGLLIEPAFEGMFQSDGTWYVMGDFPITLYGTAYAGWGLCDSKCEGALCSKESVSASVTLGIQGYVGSDDEYFRFYFK